MYEAKVLADSINPSQVRLITVQATFPRFILAEVNTHRVFSRNSASSRAIPPEKMIERVVKHPFVPETFNKRVKGMGVGDPVDQAAREISESVWLDARTEAVKAATRLNDLGIDKSRINRLLEPFMWHTAIITSTEWDNFFALRCPPGDEATIDFSAQLEFQQIAILMRRAMRASEPQELGTKEWHMPLVAEAVLTEAWSDPLFWPKVSAGRCARVSYDTHENYEDHRVSYERAGRLQESGHLSPFEHVARPIQDDDYAPGKLPRDSGNFQGWVQLRKLIPHERNFGETQGRSSWERS